MLRRATTSRKREVAARTVPQAAFTAAALLRELQEGKDVRREKVKRLQGAIRAGEYENDLKLSVAVDRLLRDLE